MADSNIDKKEAQAEELREREMEKDIQEPKEANAEENLKEVVKIVEEKEKKEEEKISKEAEKNFKVEEGRGEYKRESREDRFAREAQEKLDAWVPKTDLGRKVRSNKVKDIDEVLESGLKIMEPEITDILMPGLKVDTLFIGQAKGKFGGGKRRAFRQTQKKTKEGNVLTFGVMAVVGDGKGHIGIGYGRAAETLPAKEKAIRKAKMNMVKIKRGCASFDCSCSEPHSVPLSVKGKCSSVVIELIPAPQGTGLVVNDEIKKILRAVGIRDIYSKTSGKTRTTFNMAKACMAALNKIGDIQY
ncbi:MAG: 30S ribosomal protein S5 [Nanoarchaeota archaeon]|nr:30S ribosomal protein S5 [Nanoarchaeota archaeon]